MMRAEQAKLPNVVFRQLIALRQRIVKRNAQILHVLRVTFVSLERAHVLLHLPSAAVGIVLELCSRRRRFRQNGSRSDVEAGRLPSSVLFCVHAPRLL